MTEPSADPDHGPTEALTSTKGSGWLRASLVAVSIGFILLVIGGITLAGGQAVQVATADGRAKVGNPVRFEAEAGEYTITFIAEPTTKDFVEDRIAQMDCAVEQPDGSREELDPGSASVRTSTSVGVFAAKFRGQPGATEVLCEWTGTSDLGGFYTVARSSKTTQTIGIAALVGGVVLLLAGIGGMIRARRIATT